MLPVLWVIKEAFIPNVSLDVHPAALWHDLGQLGSGLKAAWAAAATSDAKDALFLTLKLSLIAVVANTIFGIAAALTIGAAPFSRRRDSQSGGGHSSLPVAGGGGTLSAIGVRQYRMVWELADRP